MSVNLAVVRGVCSSPAEVRVLAVGQHARRCSRSRPAPAKSAAVSVPVVAWDPPAVGAELDVGDEIVAVGSGAAPVLPQPAAARHHGWRSRPTHVVPAAIGGASRRCCAGRPPRSTSFSSERGCDADACLFGHGRRAGTPAHDRAAIQ